MLKDKITLNVLADIERKIGSTGIISSTNKSSAKDENKALVVFNGSNIDLEDKLDEIKNLKKEGVSISIAFSFMGDQIIEEDKIAAYLKPDKIYREEDILELKTIASRYSYILAPTLTISTMSKVAGALIDNFISNLIWTFLYRGKPVYVDFTSIKNYLGEAPKNKMIEELVDEKINKIKELGAIEIKTGNYQETILRTSSFKDTLYTGLKGNNPDRTGLLKNNRISRKQVLTEKDVEEIAKDKEIISLERGSILTPLAKDKIKSLGIAVDFF